MCNDAARAALEAEFGTADEFLAATRWMEDMARLELATAEEILAELPWWRLVLQVRMRLALTVLRRR